MRQWNDEQSGPQTVDRHKETNMTEKNKVWDRKNKNKLDQIIQEKWRQFQSDKEWYEFCLASGIIPVERDPAKSGDGTYRSKWMKQGTTVGCYLYDHPFAIPVFRKNRIIIRDPGNSSVSGDLGGKESGLSIHKDVAEKILVLGML